MDLLLDRLREDIQNGLMQCHTHLAASLAEENVLVATFDIAKAFDDLQLAHKKEVYCTIVTAKVSNLATSTKALLSRLSHHQS